MTTVFRSRVDRGLKAAGLGMPCVALLAVLTAPVAVMRVVWIPALATALVALVVAWIVFSTYYEFEAADFVAHSGPFAWRIPLREISAARESTSMRSGPALSMDRIEIVYREGRVLLISPEDKAGFLTALRRHAPQLAR